MYTTYHPLKTTKNMNIQQQLFPTLRRGVLRCLAAAAILALASCTDGMDDALTPPDAGQQSPGKGISFEITIAPPAGGEAQPQTRASVPLTPDGGKYKATWETGDAIGIFAAEIRHNLAATGNPIHNVRLTRQADGTWKPDPDTPLFWPRTDTQYNFAAYYPYTADMDDAAHHFTVATNQDDADPATGKTGFDASVLLFGTTDEACSRGKVVSLTLRHATTMVVLSLDDRISALDLDRGFSVTLRGVNTGVSCSPSEAALQPSAGSTSGDIVMQRVEQRDTPAYRSRFTFRALIPSTSTAGTTANFLIRNGGLLIEATAAYPAPTADAPAYRFTCPVPADALPRIPKGEVTYIDEQKKEVTLTITKDYRAGRYEVTVAQFADFLNAKQMEAPDENGNIKYDIDTWATLDDLDNQLIWNAVALRYEAREGMEDKAVNKVTYAGATAYAKWVGGRLPSLEEWQYACRAGSTTAYCFGDEASQLRDYAVYNDNPSLISPASAGTKLPNAWGLYDMHGNLWEWTSTKVIELERPTGRYYTSGGSYSRSPEECKSDSNSPIDSGASSEEVGFRVFYDIPAQ